MKERMLYMRREPVSSAAIIYLLVAGLVLLPTRWLGELLFPEQANYAYMLGVGAVRLVLCVPLAVLARQMGVRHIWLPAGGGALLFCLPALVVAVNNFPLVALIQGTAGATDAFGATLFAVECIGVGLFEELAFRGVIFPFVLGAAGTDRRGRFAAALIASAMFGALHLVNLLGGFSAGVFLQVGYSFLIGCMLAVCMFRGGGVLFCALAHALFNYGGNLVTPARGLGFGSFADIWCPAEVVLTVVVGVCAIAYFIWLLYVPPTASPSFLLKRKNRRKRPPPRMGKRRRNTPPTRGRGATQTRPPDNKKNAHKSAPPAGFACGRRVRFGRVARPFWPGGASVLAGRRVRFGRAARFIAKVPLSVGGESAADQIKAFLSAS